MAECLLLIDLQNDYFEGGGNPVRKSIETVGNAREILDCFRERRACICHVKHYNVRPNATYLLPETYGSELHETVRPIDDEFLVTKFFPNSFRETALLNFLKARDIDRLVIAGMMTHMCIDATTRAAFDHGFKCTVIYDACTTKDLEIHGKKIAYSDVHDSFMASLQGIFAQVANTDDYLLK
jgi:nicotinamidase-related amidase